MALESLPRVPTATEIGLALAAARREAGKTQGEVADAAGVTRVAVSRVERGQMNPSATVLLGLGLAVGMAVFARHLLRLVGPAAVAGLVTGGALGALTLEVVNGATRAEGGPKMERRLP